MKKGFKKEFGLALALGLSPLAHADITFDVSTFVDGVDSNPGDNICQTASNACSLRAAVQEANLHDGVTTINLLEGLYTLGEGVADTEGNNQNPIDDSAGDLDIFNGKTVIINGVGSRVTAIDGMREDRVFDVRNGAHLILNDLTVRNGFVFIPVINPNVFTIREDYSSDEAGGGIKVDGTLVRSALTLNRVAVVGNAASVGGGGIDILSSNVEINASTINGNDVVGFGGGLSIMNSRVDINDSAITNNINDAQTIIFGGGIFNSSSDGDDYLNITRSTISSNSAYRDGGGIYHQFGELKIVNSTISGNTAGKWGGGLFNADTLFWTDVDLIQTTITDNAAIGNINDDTQTQQFPDEPKGGGIYNRAQTGTMGAAHMNLFNSIVSGNGLGNDCYNDLMTSNTNKAFINKVGTLISNESCLNLNEPVPAYGLPHFQSLTFNGGGAETHALLNASDAIRLGVIEYCPDHDQRRFERRGLSCDSGAYEFAANEFSMPLVEVAIAFGGEPLNYRPEVSNLLIDVAPGMTVSGQLVVFDRDEEDLAGGSYKQITPPFTTKGFVTSLGEETGAFTYSAVAGSSGIDQFGFEYCDAGGLCDQGVVSVLINNVAVESGVTATISPGDGTVSLVTVIADADLVGTLSDADFAFPLGAMFFDVTGIPTDQSSVTVTLVLPAGLDVAQDAVVRKMNRFDTWMTLSNIVNPDLSSAVFTPAAGATPAMVTLTLVDNDIFDLDRRMGSISDPVAVGVSAGPTITTPNPTPTPTPTNPAPAVGTDVAVEGGGGGGGAAGLGYLSALLLLGLWRRRFNAIQH
ncbi:MAG: hypothetical protein L3J89_11115 [Gammaproteobacteria bacterium]|nr:hypothetical protein [Gammaproteobacteria bacterium]